MSVNITHILNPQEVLMSSCGSYISLYVWNVVHTLTYFKIKTVTKWTKGIKRIRNSHWAFPPYFSAVCRWTKRFSNIKIDHSLSEPHCAVGVAVRLEPARLLSSQSEAAESDRVVGWGWWCDEDLDSVMVIAGVDASNVSFKSTSAKVNNTINTIYHYVAMCVNK